MDDLTERRARNPLTKVEELEEANYNQIDGMLNNSMVKDIVKSVNEGVPVSGEMQICFSFWKAGIFRPECIAHHHLNEIRFGVSGFGLP